MKDIFSELFDSVEPFYLKDTLILVQGILNGDGSSLKCISQNEANRVSHTTLARFLSDHVEFWDRLESAVRKYLLDTWGNVFIVDDTQLRRSSKKIPFVKRNYDHVSGRYEDSQVLVVIGKLVEGEFMALEMKFFDKAEGTKSDAVVLASMAYLMFRLMRKILEDETKDEAKSWIRMAIESFANAAVETVRAKAKGLRLLLNSGVEAYFMNSLLTP